MVASATGDGVTQREWEENRALAKVMEGTTPTLGGEAINAIRALARRIEALEEENSKLWAIVCPHTSFDPTKT